MSKPTHLKNRHTGAIFGFNDILATNEDMVPCDKDGRSMFDEVTNAPPAPKVPDPVVDPNATLNSPDANPGTETAPGGEGGEGESTGGENPGTELPPLMIGEKPLAKAGKAEIIAFVKSATGVQIEDSLKVGEVREQAEKLLRGA